MGYGDFKDLYRRTASNKVRCDKTFNIAKYPKYDGYQRGLTSMVNKFFDKISALLANKSAAGTGVASVANRSAIKNENMSIQGLAE